MRIGAIAKFEEVAPSLDGQPFVRRHRQLEIPRSTGSPAVRRVARLMREWLAGLNEQIWRFNLTRFTAIGLNRYERGDEVSLHLDLGQKYNNRKLVALAQLSPPDAYEGGELGFGLPLQAACREQGSLLVMPAWMPHRVMPVTSGIRYIAGCFALGPSFRWQLAATSLWSAIDVHSAGFLRAYFSTTWPMMPSLRWKRFATEFASIRDTHDGGVTASKPGVLAKALSEKGRAGSERRAQPPAVGARRQPRRGNWSEKPFYNGCAGPPCTPSPIWPTLSTATRGPHAQIHFGHAKNRFSELIDAVSAASIAITEFDGGGEGAWADEGSPSKKSKKVEEKRHDKRLPEVARACLGALGAQLRMLKAQILNFDRNGCTDQRSDVKKVLANSEPSTHGT
jgi:2OG-Fe(II) oxygenase superfamily